MKFPKIATRLSVIAKENDLSIEEAKKIAEAAVKAGQVVKEVATRLEGGGVYYRAVWKPSLKALENWGLSYLTIIAHSKSLTGGFFL